MVGLAPLPTYTRCFHGEDIASYASRHAGRNSLTVAEIDSWLRANRAFTSHDPSHPDRLQAWRTVGSLHPSAFTAPSTLSGHRVTDRLLCHVCTAGQPARGRLPQVGLVCLKHRRWIGSRDQPQVRLREVLRAEMSFRSTLLPVGEVFDSPVMILAGELATLSFDPESPKALAWPNMPREALGYPIQVRIAQLLRSTRFVDAVLAARVNKSVRASITRTALDPIFGADGQQTRWRADARLNQVAAQLCRDHMAGQRAGVAVMDEWGLLQYATARSRGQRGRSVVRTKAATG